MNDLVVFFLNLKFLLSFIWRLYLWGKCYMDKSSQSMVAYEHCKKMTSTALKLSVKAWIICTNIEQTKTVMRI